MSARACALLPSRSGQWRVDRMTERPSDFAGDQGVSAAVLVAGVGPQAAVDGVRSVAAADEVVAAVAFDRVGTGTLSRVGSAVASTEGAGVKAATASRVTRTSAIARPAFTAAALCSTSQHRPRLRCEDNTSRLVLGRCGRQTEPARGGGALEQTPSIGRPFQHVDHRRILLPARGHLSLVNNF
jgi:hypothetical protein